MSRCGCKLTLVGGGVVRCHQEKDSGGRACYLHTKYLNGLCRPLEYKEDSPKEKNEKVMRIEAEDGTVVNY